MNRLALFASVVLCPAAHAQDDYGEGRKLAAAFSQADLDKLGERQARLEGAALVHAEFSEWLSSEGHQPQLEAITKAKDASGPLIESFSMVRQQTAKAPGMAIASSDAARTATLETFKRLPGEDNFTAYSRIQPQSKLGTACGEALKRARLLCLVQSRDARLLPELRHAAHLCLQHARGANLRHDRLARRPRTGRHRDPVRPRVEDQLGRILRGRERRNHGR